MKTAIEKFNKEYFETVKVIQKNFSDMKVGQKMLISSPKSIAKFIKQIPFGKQSNIRNMRFYLAKRANADNTCPLTTGIFLRIAIEASLEEAKSKTPNLPFWRLINQNSPISKKLSISSNYISNMRKLEGLNKLKV